MIADRLSYLKSVQSALKTYREENKTIDYELVRKIYNYANKIDNLTNKEKDELDQFIAENTISIHHLANIFLDKKGEEDLNHRITRMVPIQLTKPQSNVKTIKAPEADLTRAMHQTEMVKVLCKTRKKIKKAA